MKKALVFSIAAMLLIALLVPSVSAAARADELPGQVKLYAGTKATVTPIINGEVLPGEYTSCYRITKDSAGITNTITVDSAIPEYIDIYTSYDDNYIYMAAVVQEDEYVGRIANDNKYNYICLNFGFNVGDGSVVSANDRFDCTLSIFDPSVATEEKPYFTGNGYMKYDSTGAFVKSWSYMNTLFAEKKFVRTKDADGKDITIYEFSIDKEIVKTAFGFTTVPAYCYFYFESRVTVNGVAVGSLSYKLTLDDTTFTNFYIDYGWSSKSLGHLLYFGEKPEGEVTTAPDAATTAPVTEPTEPTVTTPATPSTTTKPAAESTPEPTVETTAKPSAPSVTTAEKSDDEGGCVSMSLVALFAVSALGTGITAVIFRKKN